MTCEINPFCRRVLEYHYPEAYHHYDIKTLNYETIEKELSSRFGNWREGGTVLVAGFPCQPFSCAGKRLGAEDDRYLWDEVKRILAEVKPDWFIGENVAGILSMVLPGSEVKVASYEDIAGESYEEVEVRQQSVVERICLDLESIGYSVVPFVIPACAVGANHRRDRIWFVAHRDSDRCRDGENKQKPFTERKRKTDNSFCCQNGITSNPDSKRRAELYASTFASQPEIGHSIHSYEIPNWEHFPATQPAIRGGDDGFPDFSFSDPIREKSELDRTDLIMMCLKEKRIITDPGTGKIYSTCIRGREGEKIELQGSDCNGYVVHSIKYKGIKKQVKAHQVIWMSVNGAYDKTKYQIDHINRDRKDNRIDNLRLVTPKENVANSKRYEGKFSNWDKDNMYILHYDNHMTLNEIAELYECSPARIGQIIYNHQFHRLSGITFPRWRTESIKALGNSMVPQVVYELFKAIEHEQNTTQNRQG